MSLMPKLMEINDELVRVREERDRLQSERDQAVEHAARLQAELAATHEALQRVCSTLSPKSAGQNDLVRDVSHYIEAAEVDRPTEPEFKPYTFAAYIVGDKSQPDALRIVWATEDWIQHAKFSIVHQMKDMQFFGNDGGCNITEYHETLTLNLKVQ
jgi:hypothetical protein